MHKLFLYNNFLSEERNETLNSLILETGIDDTPEILDLCLDYNDVLTHLNDFYERKNFDSTKFHLSKLMMKYNSKFDILYSQNSNYITKKLFWLSTDFDLVEIINLLYSKNDSDYLLCVLQLTSIVENSLANIYVQKGDNCPNMLTDLLNTEIIKNAISEEMVQILSLFIGSPKSLNLRNLSWHGYLWETNFHILLQYAKFMLVCLWNIGDVIAKLDNGLYFNKRNKITHLPKFFTQIDTLKNLSEINNFDDLNISFSPVKNILQVIKEKLCNQNYYQSLCLMLPLLEFYMRMVYIKDNNLSISFSIAVCNEYFVTEDVVSTQFIEGTSDVNKFIHSMGEGFCNILIETFIYPSGPRIKDIISHGEVTIVDHDLSTWAVLVHNMLFYVICVYERNVSNVSMLAISDWLTNYELTYHNYCLVKRDILHINCNIIDLINQLKIETGNGFIISDNDLLIDNNLLMDICNNKLSILFREDEVVSEDGIVLRVVANHIQHVQEKSKTVSAYILDFLIKNDVNSKKINNRNNLLNAMPMIISYLRCLNVICSKIYVTWIIRCDGRWRLMDRIFVRLIKNMVMSVDKVYSVTEKHRWTDISQVTTQFYQVLEKVCW